MKNQEEITADAVKSVLVEAGLETLPGPEESCFYVKDPESGLTFTCDLEKDILFNTVACLELERGQVTPELMELLLDAENGISTSSFQLYRRGPDRIIVTLNNFCKLQDLGPEDRDDILSCFHFLNMDVLAATQLLGE